MQKFKVTYSVTYKITDYDLYELFEEDQDAWVEFLTRILDSVRFSEDFTKRWVSTEGDELYWDDVAGVGEAQVLVTIEDNFDGDAEYWNSLLPNIKDTWGNDFNDNTELFDVNDFATLIAKEGAFWHIVKWGTTINFDENSDGCLFEYDDDARDMYLDGLYNQEDGMIIVDAEFTNAAGETYELYDWVKTKEEVLNCIEKKEE